jgi:hypothetical protein
MTIGQINPNLSFRSFTNCIILGGAVYIKEEGLQERGQMTMVLSSALCGENIFQNCGKQLP